MKAGELKLLKFLQGTNQFRIPIYQRTYSWTLDQCRQLWNDIVAVAQDTESTGHFVGSVVYIEQGLHQVADVPQLLVIDGQQRLTTVSLLLAAIRRALIDHPLADLDPEKIAHYYLVNSDEHGALRYKLVLTQSDEATLKALVDDHPLPADPSTRVLANYEFFESQVSQDNLTQQKIDLATVFNGIRKLIIVQIVLDREHDDPQRIFESLNSTGLQLSQADLIRNYVLMDLDPDPQQDLYNHFWHPMEQQFGQTEPEGQFDRFLRDYLTMRSPIGAIPRVADVYTAFKRYVSTTKGAMLSVVADVYRFAEYYLRMALGRDSDAQLRDLFAAIKTLRVDVAYPFLLRVYDDYAENRVSRTDFVPILRLIESYVFRRAIVGLATNTLNKTFATLGQHIVRDRYLESIQVRLLDLSGPQRFPTNDEFQGQLMIKDVYNFRNTLYLLGKLETHGQKEIASMAGATIEHILPQNPNLSPAWRAELGPDWQAIQSKYLHTLGNLTLTGYNPEYGDRPFGDKRDMKGGYAESVFHLTRQLAKVEHWTAEAIQERAAILATRATQIWERPWVSSDKMAPPLVVPPIPAATRAGWTEATFLSALETRVGVAAAAVARAILHWASTRELRIWWGEGAQDGSFFPMVDKPRWQYTVAVTTKGNIEIQFQRLQPPFDTLPMREALRTRLNAIPGVAIAADRMKGRPTFPLTALIDPAAQQQFFATLDWLLRETARAVSDAGDIPRGDKFTWQAGDLIYTPPGGPGHGTHTPNEAEATQDMLRHRFWQQLLLRAQEAGLQTHVGRSPSKDYWLGASAGRTGFQLNYVVLKDHTVVQLEIRTANASANKQLFDRLYSQRAAIEAAFGGQLVWRRMNDKISCQVNYRLAAGGLHSPESEWPTIQAAMVHAMRRLHAAFRNPISALA